MLRSGGTTPSSSDAALFWMQMRRGGGGGILLPLPPPGTVTMGHDTLSKASPQARSSQPSRFWETLAAPESFRVVRAALILIMWNTQIKLKPFLFIFFPHK